MSQLTLDDFIATGSELIFCSLTSDYHWIRITENQTPSKFLDCVQFRLNGYDYLYERTENKDEIISGFDGSVQEISWGKAMGGETNG